MLKAGFVLHILEVPGSNPGPFTACPVSSLFQLFSVRPRICRDSA
jgi:hypothetical protein